MEPLSDYALWAGVAGLAIERITRIILDWQRRRRNGGVNGTARDNPGHHVVGEQLRNLATLSSSVVALTARTDDLVKENSRQNTDSHQNIHNRLDTLGGAVQTLQMQSATLLERTKHLGTA